MPTTRAKGSKKPETQPASTKGAGTAKAPAKDTTPPAPEPRAKGIALPSSAGGGGVAPKITPAPAPAHAPAARPSPPVKVEARPEPKPAPRPEPRPAPRIEPRAEPKIEPKSGPKVEAKAEPKAPPARSELKVVPREEPGPVKPAGAPVAAAAGVTSPPPRVATAPPLPSEVQAVEEIVRTLMGGLEGATRHVNQELAKLRTSVDHVREKLEDRPVRVPGSGSLEEDLDSVSRALRRHLVDVMEQNASRLALPLVNVQHQLDSLCQGLPPDPEALKEDLIGCAQSLLGVLEEMGVERFEAQEREVFDPMIHQSVGETVQGGLEDGRVVKGVSYGYRSPSGRILHPAHVIVNRRA